MKNLQLIAIEAKKNKIYKNLRLNHQVVFVEQKIILS